MAQTQKMLTKSEEQVMLYLWELEKAYLKDIVEKFNTPRPAPTTVATILKILVTKGFVAYHTHGKTNQYYALLSKEEYFKSRVTPMLTNYFEGSPARLASYFAHESMSLSELEEVKKLVDERIKKLKKKK